MKTKWKDIFTNENGNAAPKEIVDTFFNKGIRVSAQKKPKWKHIVLSFIILFLLTTLALSAVFIILYSKRQAARNADAYAKSFRPAICIIKDGEIGRALVEEIYFDGDAKEKSSFLKNSVRLVNFGEHGRASLVIKFKESINLDGKSILVLARAEHGTKEIKLVLEDLKNRFIECPTMGFSSVWNLKYIFFDKKDDFDLKKIKMLKLEFGGNTTGNSENSTIYLKGLTVREAH